MSVQPEPATEVSETYFFNSRELARLAVYRAAVVARFYTDQCEPLRMDRGVDTARLLESTRKERQQAA